MTPLHLMTTWATKRRERRPGWRRAAIALLVARPRRAAAGKERSSCAGGTAPACLVRSDSAFRKLRAKPALSALLARALRRPAIAFSASRGRPISDRNGPRPPCPNLEGWHNTPRFIQPSPADGPGRHGRRPRQRQEAKPHDARQRRGRRPHPRRHQARAPQLPQSPPSHARYHTPPTLTPPPPSAFSPRTAPDPPMRCGTTASPSLRSSSCAGR